MNFRIITKNHADDSKIRYPQKIDFRADGTQESHPTAWELKFLVNVAGLTQERLFSGSMFSRNKIFLVGEQGFVRTEK